MLDSDREQIVRLLAGTGVRVVSADWVQGLLLVQIPQARPVAAWTDREGEGVSDSAQEG